MLAWRIRASADGFDGAESERKQSIAQRQAGKDGSDKRALTNGKAGLAARLFSLKYFSDFRH
jgi:hypothetical protein